MFIQILIITYMVSIFFVFIYISIVQPIVKHTLNFISIKVIFNLVKILYIVSYMVIYGYVIHNLYI